MRRMSIEAVGFAIPGALDTRTGGYGYDRRLIAELSARGIGIRHLPWPGRFPHPTEADLAVVAASLAAQPDGCIVIIDGLAFGAMPALAAAEGQRLRLVALIHHPLALETGATPGLFASEREALRHACAVITTSAETAETLSHDYDVPAQRLLVAPPGTDPAPAAPRTGEPPHLLALGSVTPRKGHDILVAALARITDLRWRCTIAGSLNPAPETARALSTQIATAGLSDRITLTGEVEDAGALYADADLFVLASRHEGFGMAYAEALAHGLPVVGTRTGAIPSVVPEAAGALVPPDDPAALAAALRHLLTDQPAREKAAAAARSTVLPRWEVTADSVADRLRRL
jgi:glycosyltransferase involved in cell wall biosynthesis